MDNSVGTLDPFRSFKDKITRRNQNLEWKWQNMDHDLARSLCFLEVHHRGVTYLLCNVTPGPLALQNRGF